MSRPRDRASAAGLLPNMEAYPWANGVTVTYRYKPLGGKWIGLGTDRDAALRKVLDMNGRSPHHGTVAWLWEKWQESKRYLRLASGTRADYALAWKQIDAHLGRLPAASMTAPMVAKYVHITRASAPRRADIEKALLSNLFRHGIMLGVNLVNPTVGVEPHGSEAERRMPEVAAVQAFTEWLAKSSKQRQVFGCMLEFTALGGARRVEFRDLVKPQVDFKTREVRLKRAKQRGKRRGEVIDVIQMTTRMEALLRRAIALTSDTSLYVFPDRDGNAYGERAFKSMWGRCIHGAMAAGVITAAQRFNFHALRHYYVTLHKGEHGDVPNIHRNRAVTLNVYDETTEERRSSL